MIAKVTKDGVVIPKKFLLGVEEVEIRTERNRIVVVPKSLADPLFDLGAEPITCDAPDASEHLDQYLYRNE